MSKLLEESQQLRRWLPLPSPSRGEAGPLPECVENLALHFQIRGDVSAGCGDGGVAKVVADDRNVDTSLQKGNCAAMAQHVGRNLVQPLRWATFCCQAHVFLQQVGDAVSGQRSP